MSVPPPEQVSNAAPMSSRVAVRRWLGVMGTIVVVFSLYFARDVLVPIVFSILVSLVLSPAVRVLSEARVPRSLAALAVVVGMLCLAGGVTIGIEFFAANLSMSFRRLAITARFSMPKVACEAVISSGSGEN